MLRCRGTHTLSYSHLGTTCNHTHTHTVIINHHHQQHPSWCSILKHRSPSSSKRKMGRLKAYLGMIGASRLLAPNLKTMTLTLFTGNAHSGNAVARCVTANGHACRRADVRTGRLLAAADSPLTLRLLQPVASAALWPTGAARSCADVGACVACDTAPADPSVILVHELYNFPFTAYLRSAQCKVARPCPLRSCRDVVAKHLLALRWMNPNAIIYLREVKGQGTPTVEYSLRKWSSLDQLLRNVAMLVRLVAVACLRSAAQLRAAPSSGFVALCRHPACWRPQAI